MGLALPKQMQAIKLCFTPLCRARAFFDFDFHVHYYNKKWSTVKGVLITSCPWHIVQAVAWIAARRQTLKNGSRIHIEKWQPVDTIVQTSMHTLLRLKRYLNKYKYHYLVGITALIAIDILQLIIPRVLKSAIDELTAGVAGSARLGQYFMIILALALGIAIGRFFWRYFIVGSSRKLERDLRTDLYRHLQTLDFSYFDTHKTGDLMAHAVNDINAVRMAMGFGFIILIDIVILGCASLIMMLNINPLLTLYALIPFPLITILSTRFGRLIHRLFEKVQESFAFLTERVRESLSGIRVVKVFVQEEAEIDKFDVLSKDYITKNVRLIRLWGMFFPALMFLATLGELIVLWFGGRSVIAGNITIGSFVAFMAYLQILIWPMIAIGWAINLFQRGAASQARLNKILDAQPTITGGTLTRQVRGRMEFKEVSFTYTGKNVPALSTISFCIEPKQFIGITGPIGSGKTCLVNLLLRLYEPQRGTILIDGKNIKDYAIENVRTNISYVPQDTFLFSDTVRANIVFGDRTASDHDVEEVARIAHIYDEIMELPHRFETHIGERGVTLSGGQKQRIALARALLMKRPIIILDDAVSSVDAETEREILSAIKLELKNRTSIVISHRVFALQDAAQIIVLDRGSIVQRGTHEELLRQGGLYSEIYKIQQLEMKLEGSA